jgi:hypothetical protein
VKQYNRSNLTFDTDRLRTGGQVRLRSEYRDNHDVFDVKDLRYLAVPPEVDHKVTSYAHHMTLQPRYRNECDCTAGHDCERSSGSAHD